MQVSARLDYAVRALLELAAADGERRTRQDLADRQGIPSKYLEAILGDLRQAGLVRSQRGPEGGFHLGRDAPDIAVADVARAVDGPLTLVQGDRPENVSYTGTSEPLQELWVAVRAAVRSVLEEVTLADLLAGQLPAAVSALIADPEAWVPH